MRAITHLLFAGCCVAAAMPALAVTYVGRHSVGATSVDVSITTDGTLGVLALANVTAWEFTLTKGGDSVVINNGNAGFTYLSGNAFQATATDIVFDYGAVGHMQWDNTATISTGIICFDTPDALFSCLGLQPSEVVVFRGAFESTARSGRFVLGTAVPGGVPEPASWAMLIAGFGLTGAAVRRRTAHTLGA